MDKQALTQAICHAFSAGSYPGDTNLVYNNSDEHWDCKATREAFKGKQWQELDNDFIFNERDRIFFLSKEGFRYYLPAFLIALVNNFYEMDTLCDIITGKLTLPAEIDIMIMSHELHKYQMKGQQHQLQLDLFLQKQFEETNNDIQHYIDYMSLFSKKQGYAIRCFLEYMNDNYRDDLAYDPGIALKRYWFQFVDPDIQDSRI